MNQLPPGPSSPRLWQTIQWILNPLELQKHCQSLYGELFTLRIVDSRPRIMFGNPQDIKEIFSHDAQDFDGAIGNAKFIPFMGANSLFTIDSTRHKQHRQLLMPPFHHQYVKNYAQEIDKITEEITGQWHLEKPLSLRLEMQKISLEIIIKVIFGISNSAKYNKIKDLITDFLNIMDSPLKSTMIFFKFLQKDWGKWTWWGQLKQTKRQIYDIIQDEINLKRNQSDLGGKDVLSLMLQVHDQDNKTLTDEEIKDELMTLFIAGHETLATSLTWALYEIHRQEKIKEQLTQEIIVLGDNRDFPVLEKLPYLTATIAETLRKYPLLPILSPRVINKTLTIGKYTYSPQTFLCPSIYLVHYREDLYPQPQLFQPERFIEKKYTNSEYFPFGGGNRRCLGYALAQLEMKLIISFVLKNHSLKIFEPLKNLKIKRRSGTLAQSQDIMFIKTA